MVNRGAANRNLDAEPRQVPGLPGCAILVMALAMAAASTRAEATDIQARLTTEEAMVGVPVRVQVEIKDADGAPAPVAPDIAGATIRMLGGPSSNRQMSIENGRVTQYSSMIYTYVVTPQRTGRLAIPPFTVTINGQTYSTKPLTLLVTQAESADLLFVELRSPKRSAYVGESINVTLQIFIRPYRQSGVLLGRDDMQSCIDFNSSEWGDFLSVLQSRRGIPSRTEIRRDSEGLEHSYYVYELTRQINPESPGTYTAGDINVVVNYPTGLTRDIFGSLRLSGTRPIARRVESSSLTIKPLPEQGRPDYFRGAVGKFDISASAKPTEVSVGDPITLTLTVAGDGRLDLLQPPPLPSLPELTRDFKVPSDPLGGVVDGSEKHFTQSIRAENDAVTRIPAIPFAYFDPATAQYVTVRTTPIPIKVKPAEKLAVSQIVDATSNRSGASSVLTERTGGILANYLDADELLSPHAFSPGFATLAVAVIPPILFAAFWFMHRFRARLREDTGYARRRSAARRAHQTIGAAPHNAADIAPVVATALREYVADRCNLPRSGLTSSEVVEQLARRGVSGERLDRVRDILERCTQMAYAAVGPSGAENGDLAGAAKRCIDELEREAL